MAVFKQVVSIVFPPSQKNEMITPIDKVSFWDVLKQRQLDHFWHNLAKFSRQKGCGIWKNRLMNFILLYYDLSFFRETTFQCSTCVCSQIFSITSVSQILFHGRWQINLGRLEIFITPCLIWDWGTHAHQPKMMRDHDFSTGTRWGSWFASGSSTQTLHGSQTCPILLLLESTAVPKAAEGERKWKLWGSGFYQNFSEVEYTETVSGYRVPLCIFVISGFTELLDELVVIAVGPSHGHFTAFIDSFLSFWLHQCRDCHPQ